MNGRVKQLFEKKSFEKIQTRIRRAVVRLGFEHLGEDAAQEFFCRVLEGKSQHQTVDQFAIDFIRERTGRKGMPGFAAKQSLEFADSYEPAQHAGAMRTDFRISVDDRLDTKRMLNEIRGRDSDIAKRFFVNGETCAEIGDHHRVSESRACQIVERISRRLSERAKKTQSGFEAQISGAMEEILRIAWERMELREDQRMAFEKPGEMAATHVPRFEKWIA